MSEETKLRFFYALLSSIFLYNCELWTLTSTLEKKIYAFQRKLLRRVLNIRWDPNNNWIANEQLYEKAAQNHGQRPSQLDVSECLVIYVDYRTHRQLKSTLRGLKANEKASRRSKTNSTKTDRKTTTRVHVYIWSNKFSSK